jgi:CHRD domain
MRHAWLVVLMCGASLAAQAPRAFKARLAPVPIDVAMQATVAGSGAATGTLSGHTLTIAGTFDGLKSPATVASIHKSPVRGVRGPHVFDLTISHATSGTIAGSLELNPQQQADLEAGRLYIQVHSEKAPDGNLWGWLLDKK